MKTAIFLVVVWLAIFLVVLGGITTLNHAGATSVVWELAFPAALVVAGLAVCFISGCAWAAEVKQLRKVLSDR